MLADAPHAVRMYRFLFFANFAHQVIIVGPDNFGHIFSFCLHFSFGQACEKLLPDLTTACATDYVDRENYDHQDA